jgi:hypothetical protein
MQSMLRLPLLVRVGCSRDNRRLVFGVHSGLREVSVEYMNRDDKETYEGQLLTCRALWRQDVSVLESTTAGCNLRHILMLSLVKSAICDRDLQCSNGHQLVHDPEEKVKLGGGSRNDACIIPSVHPCQE